LEEIAPGLWHWKALRESIGSEVSSYYLVAERVLIDPMIPPEGLGWFEGHGRPEHLLLTNRHHDRDAWKLHDAFGCTVHCVRSGLHELEGRGPDTHRPAGKSRREEQVEPRRLLPTFARNFAGRSRSRTRYARDEVAESLLRLPEETSPRSTSRARTVPSPHSR